MHDYLTRFLVVIALFANIPAFAQSHAVHEIDSVMDLSPYYMPTYYSHLKFIEYEPLRFEPVDTGMTMTHLYEPLLRPENIYQNLGISGQAHQSIIFNYQRDMGFLYHQLPYTLYFKTQSDLLFYKLKTTYSKLAYTFGFMKENQFYATFAQYVKGVTINANLYATANDGSFVNQKVTRNICGDLFLHYEIPSAIYGFRAGVIINHLKKPENGGLMDINEYEEHNKQSNAGYGVRFAYAQSSVTAFDVALQNYVNIKDKNNRYFGTFTHDFQINKSTLTYNDKGFDTVYPFYEAFDTINATNDTTWFTSVKNALQWSNFMPYKEMSDKNNFFRIAGGLLHDYTKFKYRPYSFNSMYLFARTHIRLFRVMDITAKISYAIYGYAYNDLLASAGISWALNRAKEHDIGLSAVYYRNTPEYVMQHVVSNHFRWDTAFSKQDIVQLKAFWNYKKYNASVSYYYLNKLVYLSEELRPIQNRKVGNLIQVSAFIPYRHKNLGITGNLNLQHCTNDIVRVPLFAGKVSIFYIFELLKKSLKIQLGTDIMYNTSYYADAYLPALSMFHYQNSQLVGNFVYWDANITFQIERINFFFRAGNLLSPFMHYRNFTTPVYPHKDYLFSLGISWKFFD
jgi:hypothetical protein